MSGILNIIPPEIISKEIVRHFNCKTVCNFAQASKTALELIATAATLPQTDIDLKGERVTILHKEDQTIKALLQQKIKMEIITLYPYFPIFIEIARHAAKNDSLEGLIKYARTQGPFDTTMLSLAFFDFKTKKMEPLDLEQALKLAVQYPDNTKYIQAILSHANSIGIGGTTLGFVLLEVIKEDRPKLVQMILAHPNAPNIRSACLNKAILMTDYPQYIPWLLAHPKANRITGKNLASGLITAVKANHPEAALSIFYHPNADEISDVFLARAVTIATKKNHQEVLQILLSFIEVVEE